MKTGIVYCDSRGIVNSHSLVGIDSYGSTLNRVRIMTPQESGSTQHISTERKAETAV